jgi:prepilin-type N-terminal cleavage/methylation domain-containing protein
MSRQSLTAVRSQAGFTLVELAVVMIIIGLLIGGVLKGQELINNAQITSTVAQVKGMDAATSTFRDMYSGLPGDLLNATTRLPDCTAGACSAAAGNGDGRLSTAPGAAPGVEAQGYFVQLAKADVLTGINAGALGTACGAWGQCFPAAKITGGFMIGYTGGGALLTSQVGGTANAVRNGHYLTLSNAPNLAMPATGSITANQASRIDSKVDDGNPNTGSVLSGGATACINGQVYNELNGAANCNLYIRIQG